ncbi:hypothetical protein CP533_6263 [Ophiocordyceps camponoti-saundersi (nom. inval.)]|nr:hypothetical protein CP533_6263 [Ophiocordyceps camponoti-saundersi (nom. inval.)]
MKTIASTIRTLPSRGTTSRYYATKNRNLASHMPKTQRKAQGPGQKVSAGYEEAARLLRERGPPLIPGTFISLPFSQYPRTLFEAWQYQIARSKTWMSETASLLTLKISSMRSWTKRPRWKARRSTIPPTAVALLRQSLEALAARDRETLKRICVANYADRLIATLDRRPSREGRRFSFDLGSWSLWYPSIKSHIVVKLDNSTMIEQTVVAINSRQTMSSYILATGETVPGSLRMQHKVEYVVMSRLVDTVKYELQPWKLWGIVTPTTLEEYFMHKISTEKDMIHKAGWKKSDT